MKYHPISLRLTDAENRQLSELMESQRATNKTQFIKNKIFAENQDNTNHDLPDQLTKIIELLLQHSERQESVEKHLETLTDQISEILEEEPDGDA
ncbi:MAG: hypothetical protein HRU19_32590 [Pseudobacteriovorax sp.]|nr:hypothetical protein [Pseudobacteriovorax sp.]